MGFQGQKICVFMTWADPFKLPFNLCQFTVRPAILEFPFARNLTNTALKPWWACLKVKVSLTFHFSQQWAWITVQTFKSHLYFLFPESCSYWAVGLSRNNLKELFIYKRDSPFVWSVSCTYFSQFVKCVQALCVALVPLFSSLTSIWLYDFNTIFIDSTVAEH